MKSGKVRLQLLTGDYPGRTPAGPMVMEEAIEEGDSLRSLLHRLSGRSPQFLGSIFDTETQSLSDEVAIVINDQIDHFSRGLETNLKDGDRILIFPFIAGG
jgi:molybdopterin converting factor small subunit